MFCENCGYEIKGTEKFCPSCGSPVEWNSPPQCQPQSSTPVTNNQTLQNNTVNHNYRDNSPINTTNGQRLTNYRTDGTVSAPIVNQQPPTPSKYENRAPQIPSQMKSGAIPANQNFSNGYYPPKIPAQNPTSAKMSTGAIVFTIIAALVIIAEIVLFIFPGFVTKMFHSGKEATADPIASARETDTYESSDLDDYLNNIISDLGDILDSDFELSSDITESNIPSEPEFDLNNYNTTRRPSLEDFSWYNSVKSNGKPENRKTITDSSQILRGWEAYIIHDPQNRNNSYAEELLNIYITEMGTGLNLCLNWYTVFSDGKSYDKSNDDYTYINATWNSGILSATGSYKIDIEEFYEYEGHQYAIGTLTTADGVNSYLLMVRP